MMNASRLRRSCVLAAWLGAALVFTSLAGHAQEKGDKDLEVPAQPNGGLPKAGVAKQGLPQGKGDEFGFQETWTGARISASLQMIAVPNPISVLVTRLAAAENPLTWPEWELTLDSPLPLSWRLLKQIKDKTPFPNLTQRPLSDLKPEDRAFYLVFCDALVKSHLVPADVFEKAGEDEDHRFITFDHLWRNPGYYRGQVVPVTGRMIRLRKDEAPRRAQENGVKYFWEGWVVGPTPKRNPYCIVFVTLPDGLKEAETMNQPIRFYGYYIKKFLYDAETAKRETHLLVGPTVFLEKAPPPVEPANTGIFSQHVLIATAAGFFSITVAPVLLTLWFRRGDHRIHRRIASLRDKPLDLGSAETDPPPTDKGLDIDFGPHGPRDGM
jgi:hypothetical protein